MILIATAFTSASKVAASALTITSATQTAGGAREKGNCTHSFQRHDLKAVHSTSVTLSLFRTVSREDHTTEVGGKCRLAIKTKRRRYW